MIVDKVNCQIHVFVSTKEEFIKLLQTSEFSKFTDKHPNYEVVPHYNTMEAI